MERRFEHLHEDRQLRRYAPSFFESGYLNPLHGQLVDRLADVRGKLEPGDHGKLYEAAYFAQGPIVEVGCLAGKSTIILSLGARDAEHEHPIYSIDKRPVLAAKRNLRQYGDADRVKFIWGDSPKQLGRLRSPFDTVFVDGDHSYDGVRRDLEALEGRLAPGGIVMFHDYFHPRNETGEYGVRRAVDERSSVQGWSFRGRFGGIALFEQG